MAVSLATVLADCITLLNAGTPGQYSGVVVDPRWNTNQVTDLILTADAIVCAATFRNKDNGRSALYYSTQSGLAHGGTLLAMAGPMASVVFVVTGGTAPGNRPGIEWDPAEIQYELTHVSANPLGLDFDCHYATDGKVIFHNGALIAARSGGGSVSVNVTAPTFTQASACQAADEYRWVVTCGAMSLAVPVEGENVGPMGGWGQMFQQGLSAIASGEGSIPSQVRENIAAKMAGQAA